MTGSETIAASLVLGLSTTWVLWYIGGPLLRSPLRRGGRAPAAPHSNGTLLPAGRAASPGDDGDGAAAERELRTTLTALRELERDRELGLITDEECAPLRDRHEARALVLYRTMDELAERRREALASAVAREKAALVAQNGAWAVSAPLQERIASSAPAIPGEAVPASSPLPLREGRGEGSALSQGALTRPSGTHPSLRLGTRSQGERGSTQRTPTRRTRRLAIGSAAALLVFLAGVGALWYGGSVGRGVGQPIATVRAPDYHVLAFDPVSPGRVFLGTHAGLFVSGDRGEQWRPIPTADGDVMAIVSVPGALLAAGHDVFLRSPDGSTWQAARMSLPGTDVHALAGSPTVPSRLYAAVVDRGLFRSDDTGRSWTQTGQMPSSIAALAVVPDGNGDLLYAATAQEGVLASRDGGRSWANASGFVNGALPTRQVTSIAYDGRSGDVAESQAGSFRGALFIATDRGVFRSTDGGSAWTRLGLGAEVAALAIAPDDPRTLLAVDTGGRIYRSTDRGVSW
ncbi:MAG TPA: hypothetical protein VGM69_11100 [Chloroflexota bacterium]